LESGLTSTKKTELVAAKGRIAELEAELRAMRRARWSWSDRWCPQEKAVPGGRG
jgi:hypothetical protein